MNCRPIKFRVWDKLNRVMKEIKFRVWNLYSKSWEPQDDTSGITLLSKF